MFCNNAALPRVSSRAWRLITVILSVKIPRKIQPKQAAANLPTIHFSLQIRRLIDKSEDR